MAAIGTILDAFTNNVVDNPPWSDNYGGCTEVGGRARVPAATSGAYAAYQSAHTYTLNNSSLLCELCTVPAVGGAAVEAYAAMIVGSGTDGVSAGFLVNAFSGTMRCQSNTAYWDAAATVLTFDPVAHRWLKIESNGTNLIWSTAPDGLTWTVRRTLAQPAWVGSSAICFADLSARRDSGTTDYAEFDNVNLPPSPGGGGTFTGFGIPI